MLSNIWFLPIGSSTTFDIGAHPFFGNNSAINQYDGGDQISWSHGQHQFSAGAEYHDSQWNWAFHSLSTGTMIFPTFQDFLVGLPQGFGPGYTNTFLSSIVSEPNFTTRSVNAELNHWYRRSGGAFYLQDDYKVNSSLTLNLGMRWEREGQFFEKYGEQSNLDLDTIAAAGSIQSAGLAGTFVGYKVPANYPSSGPYSSCRSWQVQHQRSLSRRAVVPVRSARWLLLAAQEEQQSCHSWRWRHVLRPNDG